MKIIDTVVDRLDRYQRRHKLTGFTFAVIKKYGDDHAGYQAALLTYYGFLSLFPLLLVLTTAAGLIAHSDPQLQHKIVDAITNYFPVLGDQLSSHIQGIHKSGLALIVGILFTLYGARGVADALRHGMQQIWYVPREKRDGFPQSIFKSLATIAIGGIGMIGASLSASFAAAAGTGLLFRVLPLLINLVILYVLFTLILRLNLPNKITFHETAYGALFAAIGLVILQAAGGYLIGHELKNLDALYSNFAIALSLLFWIYLQAQVLYYAVVMTNVRSRKLWPRSLTGNDLTEADKKVYSAHATTQQMVAEQSVRSSFSAKSK